MELSRSLPTARQSNNHLHGLRLRNATKNLLGTLKLYICTIDFVGPPRRRILGAAVFFGAGKSYEKEKTEEKGA